MTEDGLIKKGVLLHKIEEVALRTRGASHGWSESDKEAIRQLWTLVNTGKTTYDSPYGVKLGEKEDSPEAAVITLDEEESPLLEADVDVFQSLRMLTGAQHKQEVSEAKKRNDVVTNLPSLAVFAEKADGRYKSRWVCSGDKAQDTWGDTATTDLDPGDRGPGLLRDTRTKDLKARSSIESTSLTIVLRKWCSSRTQGLTFWFASMREQNKFLPTRISLMSPRLSCSFRRTALEFSLNPHDRDNLFRVATWVQEADGVEWLTSGPRASDAPRAEETPAASVPGTDNQDDTMGTENPHGDEKENISKLEQALMDKRNVFAAKRRKVESTYGF
eukprot:1688247-Amphidinium_carterae.3